MNSQKTAAAPTETHHDYPELECPICEKPQKPARLNKDGSVTYYCKTDWEWQEDRPLTEVHANTYRWRIMKDGELAD